MSLDSVWAEQVDRESLHNSLSSLECMDTVGGFDWPFVPGVPSELLL